MTHTDTAPGTVLRTTARTEAPSEARTPRELPGGPSPKVRLQRARALHRRLSLALFDLGLDRVLGDWALPTSEGLRFGILPHRQAEELVRRLEDLVEAVSLEQPAPGPGQLSLW